MNLQECCEELEELLERDVKKLFLNNNEFNAINSLLLHLQCNGLYKVPENLLIKTNEYAKENGL